MKRFAQLALLGALVAGAGLVTALPDRSTSSISARGGASKGLPQASVPEGAAAPTEGGGQDSSRLTREWVIRQSHALQLKLAYLSDALRADGLPMAHFDCKEPVSKREPVPVVWDVSVKRDGDGKRCLLYGDTEEGAVMVAPRGSNKWVALHELNRVRRDGKDGARQVADLWYGQYVMQYDQLMGVLPLKGVAAAVLLNHAHGVKALMAVAMVSIVLALRGPLEGLLLRTMASGFVWKRYHVWSQFLYWPLPMKLVVYRMLAVLAWKKLTDCEKAIRTALVDVECDMLEEYNRQAAISLELAKDDEAP